MSTLSVSPRIARLIIVGVTCLLCHGASRLNAQQAGPQGPPSELPPPTGLRGPDFSNNPYLGQRMHLDASVHYDDAVLQTIRDWPATRAHWIRRIGKVIELFDKYPHIYFIAPTPAVLEAVAVDRPDLIPQLLEGIEGGRMEITGGRWCEADTLMIGEESHVRQLFYGQQYYQKTFGRRAKIAWQTDGKGYVASYPQLLKLAGLDQILLKTEHVEGDRFVWEGLDGTQVLAVNRPYPFTIKNDEDNRRHKGTPPQVTAAEFFAQVESERSALPVHAGELLGEETGRYTSHGNIKEWMRAAESDLLTAETIATIASLHGYLYPKRELEQAWKDLLFHQQHEILGGLARGEGYEYSRVRLDSVREFSKWLTRSAMRHIAGRTPFDRTGMGVIVGNPLGFNRGGVVAIELDPAPKRRSRYEVTHADGRAVANQVVRTDEGQRLLFRVDDVPAMGWDTYRIKPLPDAEDDRVPHNPEGTDSVECRSEEAGVRIENRLLRVLIDKTTGHLISVFDKVAQRELMHGGRRGNMMIAYLEAPHKRSAKFIGETRRLEPVTDRIDTTILERGPLRGMVRLTWRYEDSIIQQFISLTAESPQLDFDTRIDWKQRGSEKEPAPMLRASFPLAPGGEGVARFGIAFGDVQRPADGSEVPALHWAMRGGPDGGAAIITTAKHGFLADKQGLLKISLVRTPYEPDPVADVYEHRFTYSLRPADPATPAALLTRAAFELNQPLVAELHPLGNRRTSLPTRQHWNTLPARFGAVELENLDTVIATCLKRSDNGKDVILRLFQADGADTVGLLRTNFVVRGMEQVNLLEDFVRAGAGEVDADGGSFSLGLRGYEIRTCRFTMFEE